MSEPEVDARPVSVVSLIEAYGATEQALNAYGSACYQNKKAIDIVEVGKLQKAHRQADENLYAAMTHNCAISHRGKIYLPDSEYGCVQVFDNIREATEIDARNKR